MLIDNLSAFVALLVSISLASERLVSFVKALFPKLNDEAKTEAHEIDLDKDRTRRILLQLLAFIFAWLTSAFLVDGAYFHNLLYGKIIYGNKESTTSISVVIVGLLASGGSAFWTNFLGYTKAVKDIRIQERATATLKYHILANSVDKTAIGSGQVSDATKRGEISKVETNSIKIKLDNIPNKFPSIQINI